MARKSRTLSPDPLSLQLAELVNPAITAELGPRWEQLLHLVDLAQEGEERERLLKDNAIEAVNRRELELVDHRAELERYRAHQAVTAGELDRLARDLDQAQKESQILRGSLRTAERELDLSSRLVHALRVELENVRRSLHEQHERACDAEERAREAITRAHQVPDSDKPPAARLVPGGIKIGGAS